MPISGIGSGDGVLVVAEQFLDVLDLLHQAVRRLSQYWGGGFGGIPQPLGGLAGLMPLQITLVPGREPVGHLHMSGDAAVRPPDQGGEFAGAP